MLDTTILVIEWNRIQEIMDYRVGDLWRAYLFELSGELSRDEKWRAETALTDLL